MRLTVREAGSLGLIVLTLFVSRGAGGDEPAPAAAEAPSAAPKPSPHAGGARGGAQAGPPGFETLADGSTRLSVELSEPVTFDTKAAPGRVTYMMKGARAAHRNDYNPLVTVDFNTPVSSARLMPHGRDLWFVVDLRAAVKPEVKMDAAKNGGMVLQIAFPQGDYVVAAPPDAPVGAAAQESKRDPPAATPAPDAGDGDSPSKPAGRSPRRRRRAAP